MEMASMPDELHAAPADDPARVPPINEAGEYTSCRHIERSLVFFPGNVRACCANPATGDTPIIAPFTGGDLSIEAVRAGRKRIKDSHKAGQIVPECQQCPKLT